ncbi:unnamed protein product [Nippostrongylus brasiliensis]|uniref:Secreted protein n=1 Tax=Nippostrongylus brasiliensis TaxID=27835 RepID=A0A0N4XVC7_NIPBR|nr:hypothetical protein Q1695_003058 [Nippostrongylus brasiliensis]VDL70327.1 unnamed protein product [Nippostrongylus brasiliensis]
MMSAKNFVPMAVFVACCYARSAVVCYKNAAKGAEVTDLEGLCEAGFTAPLCATNRPLDVNSSPSFADVMSSIKSITSEVLSIITPHIFQVLHIAYIGTQVGYLNDFQI